MNRVKISGAKAIVVVLGSEGCRRQDGFPGADRLLKNKGQREQTCISDALTKFHAENNAQQCRRITKFDREIEKYKQL